MKTQNVGKCRKPRAKCGGCRIASKVFPMGRMVDGGRQTWFIMDDVCILAVGFILVEGVIIWYARIYNYKQLVKKILEN